MAKISLMIVFLLGLFSRPQADGKTYYFTVSDSTLNFDADGRKIHYFVDSLEDQILLRFYLPGDMAGSTISLEADYHGKEILVMGKTRLENGITKNTMLFFSLTFLLWNYERQSYPGIFPGNYSKKEAQDILFRAKNWKLFSI